MAAGPSEHEAGTDAARRFDDRVDGPGYADRLTTQPEAPWVPPDDDDGLKLDSKLARYVWTAVLCDYITRHKGATSANAAAGRMGWFHLRLTRDEVMSLIIAAENESLIAEASARLHGGTGDRYASVWKLTPEGKVTSRPRGAGFADTGKRVPVVAKRMFGVAQIILGTAVGAILGALGWTIAGESATAVSLVIAGAWAFVLALVVTAYLDQRALRACALAWPRLKDYRPRRFEQVTDAWRAPLAAYILVVCTVIAALAVSAILLDARKPPQALPSWFVVAGLAVIAAAGVCTLLLELRAQRMREAYKAEYRLRKRRFWPRGVPRAKRRIRAQTLRRILRLALPGKRWTRAKSAD